MTPIKPSHATVDANHGQVDAERWDGLVPGDVGEAVSYPMANATSLHAFGTFGLSGVCDIEVSNDPQGKDETFVDGLERQWSGAIPATFVYDGSGKLVRFWEGRASYPVIKKRALEALDTKEKP